jgi:hypothetical protein
MFNLFGKKPPQKGGPLMREPAPTSHASSQGSMDRGGQTFSKVFRWRLPAGQTEEPTSVEIAGSFTHWQKVPLTRDSILDAWHTTLHHIPGNKTHHYMLFVNGEPAKDITCDGLAVPHGPHEERCAITTDRGPRVFMLFAQTK